MQGVPQRISLVAQTKQLLIQGMAEGRWQKRLPSERRLCRELEISRWTLRGALAALAKARIIRIQHGRACEILAPRRSGGGNRRLNVGYIYPHPLSSPFLRPFVALMFDEVRARVQRMGGDLDVFHGRKYYGSGCARALAQLVEQNPRTCWILAMSTRPMQEWFEQRQVPAIVGGSLHPGVRLASINIDYRAIGRHAAGVFLSRGHRRIALLASNRGVAGGYPGGLEMEQGLRETVAGSDPPGPAPIVIHHEGDPLQVCRLLDRIRRFAHPPTGLLVADSPSLLTTLTSLAQAQVVVPRDLSLIVAEDEPYYRQIIPEPTHYRWAMEEFAAQWGALLRHAIDGTLSFRHRIRLVPHFVPGGTLAAPP